MKLTVTTSSDLKQVNQVARNVKNISRTALAKIGEEQKMLAEKRIRSTKTDPDGNHWAPWSMATLRQRRRDGTAGRGLMYRTGMLLSSIAFRVRAKSLQIFSTARYAKFLQFGTGRMPARKFLGWSKQDVNKMKETIRQNIFKDTI